MSENPATDYLRELMADRARLETENKALSLKLDRERAEHTDAAAELGDEIESLRSRLDQVAEWLACSPQAEHISKRRCEELLLLVGGRIKPAVVEKLNTVGESK